jgi:hypothetical protein
MAAGLGFKTFTTGEVLTAADVNGYLMQGVLVFASEAARDAAITSPQEGQFAFTKDNNSLWYYTGAAWAASGATGDIEGVTAGTGISGGGTSGTVTITNSMATEIDAKGDLVVGTGADTFARLAVGTNDYVLTAASGETTGLKWAAPTAPTFVGCEVRKSATQAATQAAYTTLTFDTETFDTDAFHSTVTNTSRITIPSGKGGYYLVYWNIGLNGDGAVAVSLDKNGSAYKRASGYKTGGGTGYFANTEVMSLVATDYIEVAIYTTSSGLNIESDAQNNKQTTFGVAFLGA